MTPPEAAQRIADDVAEDVQDAARREELLALPGILRALAESLIVPGALLALPGANGQRIYDDWKEDRF